MKLTRILSMMIAAAMLLTCAGFASGEASGGQAKLLTVNASGLTVKEGGSWLLEGELPQSAEDITGLRFRAGSAKETFLSVSAAEHVDPAADGYTAVLGSAEELYPAPNFAEVYTNDGLNPNAEGFPLDYGWIGQIDREASSPGYGRYTAVTEQGQALLSRLLPEDAAYSVFVEGDSLPDETGGRRGPTQVSVSGGAALLVQNAYIYSEGLEGLAISNSGTAGKGSTLVVKDSLLASRGYVPAFAGQDENLPNDPLLVTGADRTNLSGGESKTYYYDSVVTVDGWASLSTDGASGDGVDLVAVDTFASALLGGYGIYADGNCRDYLYGTVLEGAEIGVIIAGTGEVSLFDGDDGLPGGAGYGVGKYGEIDPYAFSDVRAGEVGGSVIAGGRNALMLHVAGTYTADRNGYFFAKDSALLTDRALLSDEDTEYSINASWYGRELSPNIRKYLELVEGDVILLKSVNAEIVLDNVAMESYNGVLIHSVLNNDTSTPATPAGTNPVGTSVRMSNMDVTGDIVDDDYERVMRVTLDNAALNGAITSGTCEDWNRFWLDAGYAEDYTIGLASNTFGSEEPLDRFAHDIAVGEDGAYVTTIYGDDQGTELTMENGAVWNVTGPSRLTKLSVAPGCVIRGTVTVDGAVVDTAAGGAWIGEIEVLPAASGASGEGPFVGLANPWREASAAEIERSTGLALVVPDGVEATTRYMAGMAEAIWTWNGVEVRERISRSDAAPDLDTETLTALSGVYFTGMATQSKELIVGGRCPGYMEFCRGSYGAMLWYDADAGLVYTLSFDKTADPKYLGDTAEWITPLQSDAEEDSMIVIDGCAIAHDLSAVPVETVTDPSDYLWKVVSGYGITYTDENGVVWGIYRAGQAGVFEIVVSSTEAPSPWTVDGQIWVGGSKLVELCVEDGRLTHILTDELVSGPAYDVEIR